MQTIQEVDRERQRVFREGIQSRARPRVMARETWMTKFIDYAGGLAGFFTSQTPILCPKRYNDVAKGAQQVFSWSVSS